MRLLHGSIVASGYCAVAAISPSSSQRKTPDGIDDRSGVRYEKKRSEAIMATVNTTRVSSFGLADRFATFVASYKTAAAKRRLYATTVSELNGLTDRELSDLGIARIMIRDLARSAAYGN
jgi:uncharacterized protein YjiS (DUF1127 family)